MSRIVLEPKLVGETRTVTFDFSSRLAVGETISTQAVTCALANGYSGDASPSSVISGSASASGAVVSQKLTGGVSGMVYDLICTVTTSAGQTLLLSAYLAVVPELA